MLERRQLAPQMIRTILGVGTCRSLRCSTLDNRKEGLLRKVVVDEHRVIEAKADVGQLKIIATEIRKMLQEVARLVPQVADRTAEKRRGPPDIDVGVQSILINDSAQHFERGAA